MAFRAVSFDLFDTLVDLHYDHVPREQYAGKMIPPTARALHAAVAARADVDFGTFLDVASAVDRELRGERYARDLELPTEERFTALVERLGLDAPDLPGIMTEIHMGAIRRHTAVPEHHAEILIELKRKARIGLCSNFSHSETARRILEDFDLLRHFDAVVISESVGIRKPRAEIFAASHPERRSTWETASTPTWTEPRPSAFPRSGSPAASPTRTGSCASTRERSRTS
jgi:FMN phosphatase YigB (HAD superfamily)